MLLATLLLALAGFNTAQAALTTPACLAKKLKEWGKLRKCQATENAKALQGKPANPGKCQIKFDDKLAAISVKASAAAIACRYGVNTGSQAGTVTDYDTGLQWEQKTDDGSVHDKDNRYAVSLGAPWGPTGTAFTTFLGALNDGTSSDGSVTSGCFAGHCDWQLPAIEELAGIVDRSRGICGGGSGPCIGEAVFGPMVADYYWSASDHTSGPDVPWGMDFTNGFPNVDDADIDYPVLAVRSAL